MNESVFKELIKERVHLKVSIQEALPCKGKPAQKDLGSKTVYIVKISIGEGDSPLESARGGPREWASLDKLAGWLKRHGIVNYTIKLSDTQELLQQNFTFIRNNTN